MSFLVKIAAIIYRSYDDRGMDIPHFRTIVTIVFCLFLNIVHVALLFNLNSTYIMPWSSTASKSVQWFSGFIYFGILIGIVALIFKKSSLDKVEVTQKQINRCRTILPLYLAFCIVLLTVLLIKS